jgi:hypothetical protein
MPNPTRYLTDLSGLPAWVADDIASGLPRVSPESSMEAMMQARRMVRRDHPTISRGSEFEYDNGTMRAPMHPHEWDAAEIDRFGDGYQYVTRLNARGQRRGVRVPSEPIRPYPLNPEETRAIQRRLTAEALLDKGRQHPDILNQLPAVFRLPVSDDLIVRLAAQGQSPLLPIAKGAAIGAGAALGGGLAYGLAYPDDQLRAAE